MLTDDMPRRLRARNIDAASKNPLRFNTPVRASVDAAILYTFTARSFARISTMNAVPTR